MAALILRMLMFRDRMSQPTLVRLSGIEKLCSGGLAIIIPFTKPQFRYNLVFIALVRRKLVFKQRKRLGKYPLVLKLHFHINKALEFLFK